MCGRFTQTKTRQEVLQELGGIELPPLFTGRYNIAPMQEIALIRQEHPRQAEDFIWGFQHPHSGKPIINARMETLRERRMFKGLLATNRCLIPADGFYEWKGRQPYYFHLPDQRLFAFAGLWNHNRCVIITRPADHNMLGIHDRMPVIIPLHQWMDWLRRFHIPSEPAALCCRPVSRRVNSVAYDDPACLEAGELQTDLSLFPDED